MHASLSAETKAACEAEEALHWTKSFWELIINPSLELKTLTEMAMPKGVLISDSRGHSDA
jgi:hypothetical protein